MEAFISYLLRSLVISAIAVAYYCLFLRNKSFHHFNRIYLLSAGLVSLMIPFTNFRWFSVDALKYRGLNDLLCILSPGNPAGAPSRSIREPVLLFFYAGVSIVLFGIFLARIYWIYQVKRRNNPVNMPGFCLIGTDLKEAPFTFLNNLFWRNGLSPDDENGRKIFEHELTHIREGHTYDKFFGRLLVSACWINPFYWWMEKELNMIHEFIADEKSIDRGDASAFAQMLLFSHNEGRFLHHFHSEGAPEPFHSFFSSSIKRRLNMVVSSASPDHALLRRSGAIPLAIFIIVLSSFSFVKAGNGSDAGVSYDKQQNENAQKNENGQDSERQQKLKDEKLATSLLR